MITAHTAGLLAQRQLAIAVHNWCTSCEECVFELGLECFELMELDCGAPGPAALWCLDINKKLIGQRMSVLVEGQSRRNPGRWAGRTDSNKTVIFEPASSTRPGDYLDVVIERVMPQTLYGRGGGGSGENGCRNSH